MAAEIQELAALVRQELINAQIPKWDLYLLDETMCGMYYRLTATELETHAHALSYFIRVFEDHPGTDTMGIGLVQLNTRRPEIIRDSIRNAQAIAKVNRNPRYNLVFSGLTYPSPKTYDEEVWADPKGFLASQSVDLQNEMQDIVQAQITYGKFRVYKVEKMLVNSNQFERTKQSTYFCYEFSIKAQEGPVMAEYMPSGYLKSVDQLHFDDFMAEWAIRARDGLSAQKPESTPTIDVIFSPRVVRRLLLSTIGHTVTGEAIFDHSAKYQSGEHVASEQLSIYDDGLVEGGLNTSAWDSEGFPKQRTPLIEKGIMRQFLYDSTFATLLQQKSTGNAQRKPQLGGITKVEINNLVIEPGNQPLAEIVGETKKAIYVNEFSWLNPSSITGLFGAEIRNGYFIENGALKHQIKGGILSGNVYEMVQQIKALSSERRVVMNAFTPYIKFSGLRLTQ